MRFKIKLMVLSVLSLLGMFAATTSANACWIWAFYQRECPKSLLK
ncbi:cyclic lactone autoinducer peptide [Ruminiclostridium herbifermentans]|uniref:Cyclic lactone autoinducer peptide n=1 Tax=Ruminiclostridium herbifermentans TaxID=2488810 RepID=A0A4U7JDT0_9FIRM|nr:cyclic lactone autoinducer peptide [Ruminiclostridium herbifermentans]QNU65783.1 cyclic lactone autoinducer peptide [Ruminiclostridium herbifermentans]